MSWTRLQEALCPVFRSLNSPIERTAQERRAERSDSGVTEGHCRYGKAVKKALFDIGSSDPCDKMGTATCSLSRIQRIEAFALSWMSSAMLSSVAATSLTEPRADLAVFLVPKDGLVSPRIWH